MGTYFEPIWILLPEDVAVLNPTGYRTCNVGTPHVVVVLYPALYLFNSWKALGWRPLSTTTSTARPTAAFKAFQPTRKQCILLDVGMKTVPKEMSSRVNHSIDSILQSSSSRNIGDRFIRTESNGPLNFDAFAKLSSALTGQRRKSAWKHPWTLPTLLVKEIEELIFEQVDSPTVAVTSATLRPIIKAHINSSSWRGLLVENGDILMCSRV
eukprot:Em0011g470a